MKIRGLIFLICFYHYVSAVYAVESGATLPRKSDLSSDFQHVASPPDLTIPSPSSALTGQYTDSQNLSHFILENVAFSGNQVFSDANLHKVVEEWIGKSISLIDLETLRVKLTQYYRQAGYINSGVLLPKQHIVGGRVNYQIVEGTLGHIDIKGADGLSSLYIQNRLQESVDEVFNHQQLLERFQLLLSDPLIEHLNGVLKPGVLVGETLLDLTVTRRKPYELNVSFDNYTTPSVGSYTGRVDGIVRNLTGWGDFLQVDLNNSEGLHGVGSLFSVPILASNTRLNLHFQGNQSEIIENNLKVLSIKNDFYHISAGLNHSLYSSLQRSFTVEEQFAYLYTRNFILGEPIGLASGSEDDGKAKVSVLRFLQNYVDRNVERVFSLRSTFNVGIDAFDATINNTKADSRFFSWLGQGRYAQHLDEEGTEFFFRGDVQMASQTLLPVERFALGGVYTVRGYRQNELVRDNGYVLSAEIRYPLFSANNSEQKHSLKLVPFSDYGQAWNYKEMGDALWSLGLGLQWEWDIANADFYWAHSLRNVSTPKQQGDIQDEGVHFRLALKLF